MVQWLLSLPKAIFVGLILTAGVLFIVISDPPRTVCNSQVDTFSLRTKDFLKVDKVKRPNTSEARAVKLLNICKSTNSAGGCYEFFYSLKTMLREISVVSPECYKSLSSHTEFKKIVWQALDLMTILAWGSQPPVSSTLKTGWFDPADLNLYCELKKNAELIWSKEKFIEFTESYFKNLPQAQSLTRAEAWSRMLFSLNCSNYL